MNIAWKKKFIYKSGDLLLNQRSETLRRAGEDAKAYNEEKAAAGMSVFVVTDVTDEVIIKSMNDLFNSSTTMPDNPNSKYYDNPSARVIDAYSLTSNNCATVVSDVLNNSGSSVFKGTTYQQTSTFGTWRTVSVTNRFILPASMQNHLNRISKSGGTVYKTW